MLRMNDLSVLPVRYNLSAWHATPSTMQVKFRSDSQNVGGETIVGHAWIIRWGAIVLLLLGRTTSFIRIVDLLSLVRAKTRISIVYNVQSRTLALQVVFLFDFLGFRSRYTDGTWAHAGGIEKGRKAGGWGEKGWVGTRKGGQRVRKRSRASSVPISKFSIKNSFYSGRGVKFSLALVADCGKFYVKHALTKLMRAKRFKTS